MPQATTILLALIAISLGVFVGATVTAREAVGLCEQVSR